MTRTELADRALANIPGGRARFDPLTLAILLAVLGAVIQWLVLRCLNSLDERSLRRPGPILRWRFRRLVRRACGDPEVLEAASRRAQAWRDPTPIDAGVIDGAYGDDACAALLATGAGLSEAEAAEFLRRNR